MSDPGPADGGEQRRTPAQEAELRRRLESVFGDVLPEGASDERPDAWGDGSRNQGGSEDDWLRGQVPPHHG